MLANKSSHKELFGVLTEHINSRTNHLARSQIFRSPRFCASIKWLQIGGLICKKQLSWISSGGVGEQRQCRPLWRPGGGRGQCRPLWRQERRISVDAIIAAVASSEGSLHYKLITTTKYQALFLMRMIRTMGQWDFILDCTICWYWQDLVIVNHSHNLVWLSCIHKLYLDILSEARCIWKQGEIVFWGNRNVGLQTSYWGGRGSKLRCRQNILYFLQNPSKCCDFVKSKSIVPCPPSPLP